jgi:bifunctional UDP-N-acetylglucosamine pyrophosphorylase/glucosamine-1-phosphate N-acetyltransferase
MHTQNQQLSVIILGAGKGTRMKSEKAKVLHTVFFSPMIEHVINAVSPLNPMRIIVVVGHQQETVKNALHNFSLHFAEQTEQLGTGHAVLATRSLFPKGKDDIMILCGDTPLVESDTLRKMYEKHSNSNSVVTLMTTLLDKPTNYGRILSDENNKITGIVEEKDATETERKIKEINAGIYCVQRDFLFQALDQVGMDNSQGEMYLTDIISIAVKNNKKVERFPTSSPTDILGVNSRIELAQAHNILRQRRNIELMQQGITMYSPDSISIAGSSKIGCDSILSGEIEITGNTIIGKSCTIGRGVILNNCRIGDQVTIGPYSCLYNTTLPTNTDIAPHTVIGIPNGSTT